MIDWQPIDTAPTTHPRSSKDNYLIGSFPKGAMTVGHMSRLNKDAFTTFDGVYHAPTHWASLNAPGEGDRTDWVAEAKDNELAFMVAKDEYSGLARALGVRSDAFFGDPLESHQDVVRRANSIMACLTDAEITLQPFARFSETYPNAKSDVEILSMHDHRCPVTIGDLHAAKSCLDAIRPYLKDLANSK